MNEFDYEVKSRKSLVPSAKKRRDGSKSRKCSLPSDHLSRKEWNERNGPVMTFNPSKPMSWEQFTNGGLSPAIKEEYLNGLIARYSVNQRIIAQMFGIAPATLQRAIKKENLNVNFVKGKFPNKEQMEQFRLFLEGYQEPRNDDETIDEDTRGEYDTALADEYETVCTPPQTSMKMREFTIKFEGKLNIDEIANSIRFMLGGCVEGEMEIACKIN